MALGLYRHWNSWLVAKTSLVEIHIYIYISIYSHSITDINHT